MIVGVEPFFHCQSFDITSLALITARLGKIGVQRRQTQRLISLWHDIQQVGNIQGVIEEGKIASRNLVNASRLNSFPIMLPQGFHLFL